jgi:hypothetical protein
LFKIVCYFFQLTRQKKFRFPLNQDRGATLCSIRILDDSKTNFVSGGEPLKLPLLIKPSKVGFLHQRVTLFLDHPKQFRLKIDLFGSVKGDE